MQLLPVLDVEWHIGQDAVGQLLPVLRVERHVIQAEAGQLLSVSVLVLKRMLVGAPANRHNRCLKDSNPRQGSCYRLVFALECEVGSANHSGKLRFLACELEPGGELIGYFHPLRKLEPDSPLRGIINGVHYID